MGARELIKKMMLSMMAHPDYITYPEGEFNDYVSMAQDYLNEPQKRYDIDINGIIKIGIKCESEPVFFGAMDGGGNPIDLERIIIKEDCDVDEIEGVRELADEEIGLVESTLPKIKSVESALPKITTAIPFSRAFPLTETPKIDWGFSEEEERILTSIKTQENERLKDWVEQQLQTDGLSRESHPAEIIAQQYNITRTILPMLSFGGWREKFSLYKKGKLMGELIIERDASIDI